MILTIIFQSVTQLLKKLVALKLIKHWKLMLTLSLRSQIPVNVAKNKARVPMSKRTNVHVLPKTLNRVSQNAATVTHCNLLGITSIIELENWQCPLCYETLFADPSKAKTVMNTLKEIHIDVNSIQNKCDNFSTLDFFQISISISNYISQISITITIEFNNLIYSIRTI